MGILQGFVAEIVRFRRRAINRVLTNPSCRGTGNNENGDGFERPPVSAGVVCSSEDRGAGRVHAARPAHASGVPRTPNTPVGIFGATRRQLPKGAGPDVDVGRLDIGTSI